MLLTLTLYITIVAVIEADYSWMADLQPVVVVEIKADREKVIK